MDHCVKKAAGKDGGSGEVLYVHQRKEKVRGVKKRFEQISWAMDERMKRLWAGSEAIEWGYGGISGIAEATGISFKTVQAGIQEIQAGPPQGGDLGKRQQQIRKSGGGRRSLIEKQPELAKELEQLIEPATRGDPTSPWRWSSKSVRKLSKELGKKGFTISPQTVGELLKQQDYSLQSNRKSKEGANHPDRDAQFQHIASQVRLFQERGQPAISVDAKKKEAVGDFKNGGQEWHRKGQPEIVRMHDFPDPHLGKANLYGVFDLTGNQGWVSVGIDHDTSEFAVETIHQWWQRMGAPSYPEAQQRLITADAGGSNGYRTRLWKQQLQELADKTGLEITVCHFPPGTSKWNKIEHRMFCHITENWRGRPLVSLEVIVNLIANTKTEKGLTIQAGLDSKSYPKGLTVGELEMAEIKLQPAEFHGEWNYTISPKP